MEYTAENSVLVKVDASSNNYYVMNVEDNNRHFVLFEEEKEGIDVINHLLETGAKVFNSMDEFQKLYPPLGADETKRRGMQYWKENVPKEKWPKEIRDYFDKEEG